MKVYVMNYRAHNPYDESHWVSRLRENLTSGSYGEGLETGRGPMAVPRQPFTRQRTFSWLLMYRRLSRDYEVLAASSECWIYMAMSDLMLKRLCGTSTPKFQPKHLPPKRARLTSEST